ncbi:phosphonoacetaldehyde hydrolase [Paraglaciecola sp.]|uniref:phosphonoacetaldehyde hydrolase n=1 Tax=Paraglaciecola sp. TaxID=1920173 RepID=UPI0030F392FA
MRKIEALILDWAGTVVDFGSVAPTSIFVKAFKQAFDFDVSIDEARAPMGLGKWDHIKTLSQLPAVSARWQAQFGSAMDDSVVDEIYATFMPMQKAIVAEFSTPIPGVLDCLNWVREQGIKIGSCSGYPREVMEVLVIAATSKGYTPDCWVASDDLAAGSRPGPWMALQNVIELGINDVANCIKFDDSLPGILEGLHAGMWTVGIAVTGNILGLTEDEWHVLAADKQAELREKAHQTLLAGGAHYVVDSLADAIPVIQQIQARIAGNERP